MYPRCVLTPMKSTKASAGRASSADSGSANLDAMVAGPHASFSQLTDASNAYNTLGDELGQAGPASLNDLPSALAAYRRGLDLANRALSLDPNSLNGRGTLILAQMKESRQVNADQVPLHRVTL